MCICWYFFSSIDPPISSLWSGNVAWRDHSVRETSEKMQKLYTVCYTEPIWSFKLIQQQYASTVRTVLFVVAKYMDCPCHPSSDTDPFLFAWSAMICNAQFVRVLTGLFAPSTIYVNTNYKTLIFQPCLEYCAYFSLYIFPDFLIYYLFSFYLRTFLHAENDFLEFIWPHRVLDFLWTTITEREWERDENKYIDFLYSFTLFMH